MKLKELAAAMGLKDYGTVSSAIRRFERLLRHEKVERQQWNQLCQKYINQTPRIDTTDRQRRAGNCADDLWICRA
jgi:hypothetical protein